MRGSPGHELGPNSEDNASEGRETPYGPMFCQKHLSIRRLGDTNEHLCSIMAQPCEREHVPMHYSDTVL
jgi:hypothetical protein